MTPKQPEENGNLDQEIEQEEKKEIQKNLIDETDGVIGSEITGEMESAYIDYAMSVIVSRALPSVEDGLKPVHRRILYAMNSIGLQNSKPTKKCARIVGDVLGKYHPHGDTAVYDALVRMAQNFSLRYPLIQGQGNFGCFTADTKVKLTDGRNLTFIELIEEHKQGKRNFTFTIDKNNKIKISEIKNPRKTKENTKIMKVILDNGEEIKCTLNHRFMLKNGKYKEAQELKSGDSLMPAYFKFSTKKDDAKAVGYKMIFQPKSNSWDFVHILSDKWNIENNIYKKSAGRIKHHINFNKLDNDPDNIRRMNWKEHWKTHYTFTSMKHQTDSEYKKKIAEGRKRFWDNPKNRKDYSKRMTERNLKNWKNPKYAEKMKVVLSEVNKKYLKEHPERIEEIRKTASITMTKMWQNPRYKRLFNEKITATNKKRETNLTGKKKFLRICNYLKENNINLNKTNYEKIRKEIFEIKSFTSWDLGIEKYYQKDCNLLLCDLNQNHKVVKAEFLNELADVYDISIDNTHNFSLASGIFVHNSIDGDPQAAMRYTEAKLASISSELLQDLEKETVKMLPNFDNSLKEPEVLPGKLPNLLINGASGIAVGMATNIPPHNLTEVCDAITKLIDKPDITIEKLANVVTGPDFPTGASITSEGILEMYKTGKGRVIMRGKTTTEESKGKTKIIITEIPYMLNKSDLIVQIAKLAQDKKLPDVSDIRDESAKGKIRIVIELRKGSGEKFTLNRIYKNTRLQDTFNTNMIALVQGKPRVLNLKMILEEYIKHRRLVITKRSKFELKKAEARLEIVLGLLKALQHIDAIVKLIKASKNPTLALENLIKKFSLTRNQAQAILDMKLSNLTGLEAEKLKKEKSELEARIKELNKILGSVQEVLSLIKKDISEIKRKYGDERRTKIIGKLSEIKEQDLVQKKDVVVTITDKGYCKRIDVKNYREQKRGGKGVIGSDLSTGDFVKQLLTCSTHDYLLLFTSKGKVYWLKAHEIPAAEKYSKGKALINLLNLKDEEVQSVISIKKFEDHLMFATKKGIVKKLPLAQLSKPRASGVKAINLPMDNSDELVDVQIIKETDETLLVTKKGQAIHFKSPAVRPMGRASYGVTGIKMNKDDEVVSLEILNPQSKNTVLTITEKGYGKRSEKDSYRLTGRAGKGVINLKVSAKTGPVVTTVSVAEKDDIIVSTAKGIVIRTQAKQLRVMGRATQGVRIVKLQEGDKVSDLARVHENNFASGEVE